MATHLDLEEQEQLEDLKAFWKQYGNLITWIAIVVLAALAGWNAYQYWQRSQAVQAAAMFDEVQRVVQAGDPEKIERAFNDMKDRFAGTAYASQAGLQVGKVLFDAGKLDGAKAALQWVVDKSPDAGYASVARLRLAGVLLENKEDAQALKLLDADMGPEYAALRADRRGDIEMSMGNKAAARADYLVAYQGLDAREDYRRLVEVKLNALGVDPVAAANSGSPAASK